MSTTADPTKAPSFGGLLVDRHGRPTRTVHVGQTVVGKLIRMDANGSWRLKVDYGPADPALFPNLGLLGGTVVPSVQVVEDALDADRRRAKTKAARVDRDAEFARRADERSEWEAAR